MHFTVAFYQAA